MSLKSLFDSMKKEGYIVPDLDEYLRSLEDRDSDRAINVNAPSAIGGCLRERFYSRTGASRDPGAIDPRNRRILDNGTFLHLRLQGYLTAQGMLLLDEIPVYNKKYQIQGHTDGLLKISKAERAILEIKSINAKNFKELIDAKPEHKQQGLTYVFCIEKRRKELHELYPTVQDFADSEPDRMKFYASLYQHVQDGHKYTKKEKIAFQCKLHKETDSILYDLQTPITKCIFLYENKDTQDLKEYCVSTKDERSKEILKGVLVDCKKENEYVKSKTLPPREGSSKSDQTCRWCAYKTECWN